MTGGGGGRLPGAGIAEAHRLEGDPEGPVGELHSPGPWIGHVGSDVEHVQDPTPARHRRLRLVDRLAQYLHRLDEELDQEQEGDHRPHGDGPVDRHHGAHHHHRRQDQRREDLAHPGEGGGESAGGDAGPAVVVDGGAQPPSHPGLDAVGADDGGSHHHLGEHRQHPPHLLPHGEVGPVETGLEPLHGEEDDRERGRHHAAQERRVDEHDHQRQQCLAAVGEQHQSRPLHEPGDLVDIRGDTRDEGPPLLGGLVEHGEIMDVTEGAHPQPRQRRLRDPGEAQMHPPGGGGGDQHRPQGVEAHAQHEVHVHGAAAEAAVDDLLDGDRHHHPAGGGDERQDQGAGEAPAELRRQAQPPPDGGEGALAGPGRPGSGDGRHRPAASIS